MAHLEAFASRTTCRAAVESRRTGSEVEVLERILDQAALEQFTIDTTDASITDVAAALLRRAHWIG